MKRPKPLKSGDKIALIAPCGPVKQDRIELSIKSIEKLGLHVVLCESCICSRGFLAGKSDKARAEEVNSMFKNKDINGIFAMRGGYGASRILPMLDYDLIKANPKVFVGYSDVTALHIVFNQKCGFVTFHGPMASTELYKGFNVSIIIIGKAYKNNLPIIFESFIFLLCNFSLLICKAFLF